MNPNAPETENLWNLMGSTDTANHALAFQLMKGLGMPAEIKTFLQEWRSFFQKTQKKPFSYMKVLEALSEMTEIVLQDSRFTKLPQSYRLCHWVTSLHLYHLKIDKLPESIFDMPLTHFSLFDMALTTLPATIGKLQNLKYLRIVSTKLEYLPATIGKLQNLEYLEIKHTQLAHLPATIGELSKVKDMNLCYNQLENLPHSFKKLHKLETLLLTHNRLKRIPSSLIALEGLQNVSLAHNQIAHLPKILQRFGLHKFFHLEGNPVLLE